LLTNSKADFLAIIVAEILSLKDLWVMPASNNHLSLHFVWNWAATICSQAIHVGA